jgi:hypothetical protein
MFLVPFINPLRFTKQGYHTGYNTKFFDEHLFPDTIRDFEQPTSYCQPWNLTDDLHLIIYSDIDTVNIDFIRNSDGGNNYTLAFTNIGSFVHPDYGTLFIHKVVVDLTLVGEDCYSVYVSYGTSGSISALTIVSNSIEIINGHADTVLINYKSSVNYQDVLFEVDDTIEFFIRVHGFLEFKQPERESTVYADQILNLINLKTVPFRLWQFICRSEGVPHFMIDIINGASGCETLLFDNREFTVPEGAKWDKKEEEGYPLKGWAIDLRESVIKASMAWDGTTIIGGGSPSPELELVSDYFQTTTGSNELAPGVTSGEYGYTIGDIVKLIGASREGGVHDIVTVSSPVGLQVKHDTGALKIIVDPTIPFALRSTGAPETVFLIFYK